MKNTIQISTYLFRFPQNEGHWLLTLAQASATRITTTTGIITPWGV